VRFGAYHIYVPALLKPAPRALAAQLWALSHDGPQTKGLDDLLHLAGSGRTSIPVNRDIDAVLYRTAGYRVCGERAVRVDILERLADLIRPALAWREGADGPKPTAAVGGGGFTVVNGMTSLIGCAGEDFGSILRSLGYRMERRPKPAAPAPVAQTPDAAAEMPEATAAVNAPVPAIGVASMTAATVSSEPSPPAEQSQPAAETGAQNVPPTADGAEPGAELVTESAAATGESASPLVVGVAAAAGGATEQDRPAEEPVLIEVWRPGRPDRRLHPRGRYRDAGEKGGSKAGREAVAPPPPPAVVAGEAASSPPTEPTQGAAGASSKAGRHSRHHRRPGPGHRFDRLDRAQREREPAPVHPARFERREKAPDPNSPFAKLAALKAQLEANAKERR
jgi:ATP-dependent RNA helicase SUPV3L1/SUV3